MKFAVIAALFASVVVAGPCTVGVHSQYYVDKDCMKKDSKTGRMGQKDADNTGPGVCNAIDGSRYDMEDRSMNVQCDAHGIKQTIWHGLQCKGEPFKGLNCAWEECCNTHLGFMVFHDSPANKNMFLF